MRAAIFRKFQNPIRVEDVPEPEVPEDAALIDVKACGICRSDWHAWMGHDTEVQLPHVPGHELSGVVAAVGTRVQKFHVGDRITVPFCCGCGSCPECNRGNSHICDAYTQPGFTHWGAFSDRTIIRAADWNLVRLPSSIDFVSAASLGCRFITAFRALVDQAKLGRGEWLAVHGCGGVGLSAIMIAKALHANVIAIDVQPSRLDYANQFDADHVIDATCTPDVPKEIKRITGRGAHASLDALGSPQTCWNSIECLAKRGRHVQVGLMLAEHASASIPMAGVIAKELEIYGSHGMQPTGYERIFEMIQCGLLLPDRLVSDTVNLERGADLLTRFASFPNSGMTIIDMTL